jgi:hypothetical protein
MLRLRINGIFIVEPMGLSYLAVAIENLVHQFLTVDGVFEAPHGGLSKGAASVSIGAV